jgi:hypothetical protein
MGYGISGFDLPSYSLQSILFLMFHQNAFVHASGVSFQAILSMDA